MNNKSNMQIDISKEFENKTTIHANVNQNIIVITQDKVENILLKKKSISLSKTAWIAPCGLSVTTITTLMTCNFKDFLLKPEVWMAIYIVISFLCLCWLIWSLWRLIQNWKRDFEMEVIGEMKNQSNDSPLILR